MYTPTVYDAETLPPFAVATPAQQQHIDMVCAAARAQWDADCASAAADNDYIARDRDSLVAYGF